jgi:hypothetical protein
MARDAVGVRVGSVPVVLRRDAASGRSITLRTAQPLPPRVRLDLDLHLADIDRARRVRVRGDEVNVAWIDPPPRLLSRFLLADGA